MRDAPPTVEPATADEPTHKVVFYDRGLLNWGRPRHGDYGSRSTGMFGLIPDLLERHSIGWDRVKRIESWVLENADALVLLNMDEPLTEQEHDRIWQFVARGGRLLVLGDHTMQHEPGEVTRKLLNRYVGLADDDGAQATVRRELLEALKELGAQVVELIQDRYEAASTAAETRRYLAQSLYDLNLRYGKPGPWVGTISPSRRELAERFIAILGEPTGEIEKRRKHILAQIRRIGLLALPELAERIEQLADNAERIAEPKRRSAIVGARYALQRLRSQIRDDVQVPEAIRSQVDDKDAQIERMLQTASRRRNFTNDLLATHSGIQFNFDTADFAVGGWLHGLEYPDHPTTWGMGDRLTEPGHVVGASLDVQWPARPLLVGKHGFVDRGDYGAGNRAYLGSYEFEGDEPLGDLVLAAWGPFGDGQVYVFGDTSGFANAIMTASHRFVSRVFGVLTYKRADGGNGAVFPAVALLILGGIALAVWGRHPEILAAIAVALLVFGGAVPVEREGWFRAPAGPNVAYVDATHLSRAAGEGWRPDGLMGLHLNLSRAGYHTMNLDRWSRRRLDGAALVISVAPTRPYSREELDDLERLVRRGGKLILTIGGQDTGPARSLLERFGFRIAQQRVPPDPQRAHTRPAYEEAGALGYFKLQALEGGEFGPTVMFYEAWPVRPARWDDELALAEWVEQKRLDRDGNLLLSPDGRAVRFRPVDEDEFQKTMAAAEETREDAEGNIWVRHRGGRVEVFTPKPLAEPDSDYELIAHYHSQEPARRVPVAAGSAVRATFSDPLILSRRLDKGRVAVIADSHFATNKNLEEEEQPDPQNIRYIENIQFWRWLLAKLESKKHLSRLEPKEKPQPPTVPATEPATVPATAPTTSTAPASRPPTRPATAPGSGPSG
jgi:hypothetical protein